MNRSLVRRLIFALALGVVLVSPGPAAAGPRLRIEHRQMPYILSLPGEVMSRFLNLVDRVLTKTGCSLDPHGLCAPGQGGASEPAAESKTGSSLDPHGTPGQGGASEPSVESDNGCTPDPHGGCGR